MRGLFTALILTLGLLTATAASAGSGGHVGDTAPDFTLHDLDGRTVSLAGLRKSGYVLVIFWSTQCPICHHMLPEFKRTYRDYDGKGLTVAAVDIGLEDENGVQAYALQYDLPYLVLNQDSKKQDLQLDYDLIGTPTIVLVGPDGKVAYRGHRLPDLRAWLGPRHQAAN